MLYQDFFQYQPKTFQNILKYFPKVYAVPRFFSVSAKNIPKHIEIIVKDISVLIKKEVLPNV